MTQTHKSSISVSMVAADSRPVHTCEISSAVHSGPQGWMGGVSIRGEPPAPWRPVTPHLWACKDHQTKLLKESLIKPSFVSHSPPYFLSFLRRAFVPSLPEGLLKHRPGLKRRWSRGYGLFATVAGTKNQGRGLFLLDIVNLHRWDYEEKRARRWTEETQLVHEGTDSIFRTHHHFGGNNMCVFSLAFDHFLDWFCIVPDAVIYCFESSVLLSFKHNDV